MLSRATQVPDGTLDSVANICTQQKLLSPKGRQKGGVCVVCSFFLFFSCLLLSCLGCFCSCGSLLWCSLGVPRFFGFLRPVSVVCFFFWLGFRSCSCRCSSWCAACVRCFVCCAVWRLSVGARLWCLWLVSGGSLLSCLGCFFACYCFALRSAWCFGCRGCCVLVCCRLLVRRLFF